MMLPKISSHHVLRLCILFTLVFVLVIISTRTIGWHPEIFVPVTEKESPENATNLQCENVLGNMLEGKWVKQPYVQQEMERIQYFLHTSRMEHFLPYNLQREDQKCGNETFDELKNHMNNLLWFRALCDPEGDTPCCYDNHCVSRSEEMCRCENCYDMRQQIHAEFAKWVPSDPTCKITHFRNEKDTCQLLHNMTIYIIGDSFMRHVYISLLALLRSEKHYGPLKQYTAPGMIATCDRDFVHVRMCMNSIDRDTWECNRTVKLKFMEHAKTAHTNLTLEAIRELQGRPNSLLFIGIGIHDDFNATLVVSQLLNDMLSHLSHSPWPRALWAATHAPGLLKTPRVPSQNKESVLRYNSRLRSILDVWRVPVFDSFQLTDGTVSFDGAHYGRGINDVKAQIFLNYILELRTKNEIPWTS